MNNRLPLIAALLAALPAVALAQGLDVKLPENLFKAEETVPATETEELLEAEEAAEPQTPGQSKINEALAQIPYEKAQIFDKIMRKNVETNRDKRILLRSLYTDIRDNFVGPTFDKEAFLKKSEEARKLQEEIRANLDRDLAEIANQFNQEERQIIFNALPARYTREY